MAESAAELQHRVENERKARVVYEFKIPDSLKTEEFQSSVGLVKLSGREEHAATKRAKGDQGSLAFELVKASLFEVDGKRLNRSKFEDERVWNAMDPKLRNLVMAAYAHLHSVEDEEAENFIQGVTEKVG